MQNIKLAFKLHDWLWFSSFDYVAVWKQDITVNVHVFGLSLALNFQSIPLHRPAVIG
jgi:hypothetical protein